MATKNALSANKSESKKRVTGIASIKAGETKVRVTFQNEELVFDNGKNSKTFSYDDLPKSPKIVPNTEEDYFVVLAPDRDEIQSIGPVEGVFSAKCVDLSRPNDDPDAEPEPFEVNPKEGDPYQAFNAFFEIQSGPYKKLKVPYFLHYKFEESREHAGMTAWSPGNDVWKGRQTHLGRLKEFCMKFNAVAEPIEWPEDGNILPILLERILESNETVKIVIKNGYIDSLMSVHNDEADNEDESPKTKKKPSRQDNEDDDL